MMDGQYNEELTLEEAARKIREFAELTAQASKNWDNFQEIVTTMMQQAYAAGVTKGMDDLLLEQAVEG